MQLGLLRRHGQRQRLVGPREGVHQPEEVPERGDHARSLLVVPVDLQDDLPVVVRVDDLPADPERVVDLEHRHADDVRGDLAWPRLEPARLRHPDVGDRPRPLEVGQDALLARADQPVVPVATGLVPARGARRSHVPGSGEVSQDALRGPGFTVHRRSPILGASGSSVRHTAASPRCVRQAPTRDGASSDRGHQASKRLSVGCSMVPGTARVKRPCESWGSRWSADATARESGCLCRWREHQLGSGDQTGGPSHLTMRRERLYGHQANVSRRSRSSSSTVTWSAWNHRALPTASPGDHGRGADARPDPSVADRPTAQYSDVRQEWSRR